MSTQLKLRRGTTAQHSTFTGAEGEVTVDTTKDTLVVHDGTTAGGKPVLTEANPSYTGTLTGGTGVVNLGSGQVYKDASGNVGIGTSSPGAKLNIAGGTAGTYADGILMSKSGGNLYGVYPDTNDLIVRSVTGATEVCRFTYGGNVGIGTSSPTSLLHVYKSSGDLNAQIETAGAGQAALNLYNSTRKFRLIADASANALVIYDQTASAERARIDSSGQMHTTNGAGVVAKAYDCRAWVNFNGTGTVAIRGSGNVSSITDISAGVYGVNFATAMPDANYSTATATSNVALTSNHAANTASVVYVSSMNLVGTRIDDAYMNVSIFR